MYPDMLNAHNYESVFWSWGWETSQVAVLDLFCVYLCDLDNQADSNNNWPKLCFFVSLTTTVQNLFVVDETSWWVRSALRCLSELTGTALILQHSAFFPLFFFFLQEQLWVCSVRKHCTCVGTFWTLWPEAHVYEHNALPWMSHAAGIRLQDNFVCWNVHLVRFGDYGVRSSCRVMAERHDRQHVAPQPITVSSH